MPVKLPGPTPTTRASSVGGSAPASRTAGRPTRGRPAVVVPPRRAAHRRGRARSSPPRWQCQTRESAPSISIAADPPHYAEAPLERGRREGAGGARATRRRRSPRRSTARDPPTRRARDVKRNRSRCETSNRRGSDSRSCRSGSSPLPRRRAPGGAADECRLARPELPRDGDDVARAQPRGEICRHAFRLLRRGGRRNIYSPLPTRPRAAARRGAGLELARVRGQPTAGTGEPERELRGLGRAARRPERARARATREADGSPLRAPRASSACTARRPDGRGGREAPGCRRARLLLLPVHAGDAERAAREELGGEVAERRDNLRLDQLDLPPEVAFARLDLVRLRVAVPGGLHFRTFPI